MKSTRAVDHTGQRFNRLTVTGKGTYNPVRKAYVWNTVCECGRERAAFAYLLINGTIRQCSHCQNEERGRTGLPQEIRWEFTAPYERITQVAEELATGPKTVAELKKATRIGLDSIMDCVALLFDSGRLDIRTNLNGDRVYKLR